MEKIEREISKTSFKLIEKESWGNSYSLKKDFNCLACGEFWEYEIKLELLKIKEINVEIWNKYSCGDWDLQNKYSIKKIDDETVKNIERNFDYHLSLLDENCLICKGV